MRMKDKTVAVVGGMSAFGKAIISNMLLEGAAHVAVLDTAENTEAAAALAKDFPERFAFFSVDTSDIEAMDSAAQQIVDKFETVDALVNLQDEKSVGGLMDISEADWNRVICTNLTQLYYSCHAFIPFMKRAHYGRVVNLTSVAGRCYSGADIAYTATKSGVMGFTRGLAMEVREAGITANSIAVGDLADKMVLDAAVHAVLYLASDEASWTTGDCMDVNNGTFMQN